MSGVFYLLIKMQTLYKQCYFIVCSICLNVWRQLELCVFYAWLRLRIFYLKGERFMKCSSCGAEVGNTKFCEYCGSQISAEMQKEQEQLNKSGCPKCGSTNIKFVREKQGETKGKKGTQIMRATTGVCNDCGYTWETQEKPKKKKTWLWVLGWIFIFPVPLTIILLRKKDMNKILKYCIIAVAWIVYIAIALSGGEEGTDKQNVANDIGTTSVISQTEETTFETTTQTTTIESTTKNTTTEKKATLGEVNALGKAKQYLDYSGFSKKSLKDQLKYEGFSSDEIDYAIKKCGADWNEECAEKAQEYLDFSSFSKQGLKDQLEYEGFTDAQIEYALEAVGY